MKITNDNVKGVFSNVIPVLSRLQDISSNSMYKENERNAIFTIFSEINTCTSNIVECLYKNSHVILNCGIEQSELFNEFIEFLNENTDSKKGLLERKEEFVTFLVNQSPREVNDTLDESIKLISLFSWSALYKEWNDGTCYEFKYYNICIKEIKGQCENSLEKQLNWYVKGDQYLAVNTSWHTGWMHLAEALVAAKGNHEICAAIWIYAFSVWAINNNVCQYCANNELMINMIIDCRNESLRFLEYNNIFSFTGREKQLLIDTLFNSSIFYGTCFTLKTFLELAKANAAFIACQYIIVIS